MRLGQLARQLDVKPEKIISYLEKEKQLTIKSHPNSKVEDELIDELTAHFKPAAEEVEVEEAAKVITETVPTKEETIVEEEAMAEVKEPEHIETAKPEPVQELKIVGKIDLPDKSQINIEVDGVIYDQETLDNKKKEALKEDRERKVLEKEEKRKEDEERKTKAREQRAIEAERRAMLETEKHNILTKEEEKKNALILKAQEEREHKLEERRKKQQKEHYSEKMVANKPVQKKKVVVTEEVVENHVEEVRETNPIKRFIKWLNT